MKRLVQLIFLCFLFIAVQGCVQFSGDLKVYSYFTIKSQSFSKKPVTYSSGSYDIKLKYHQSEPYLEISSDEDDPVSFNVPKYSLYQGEEIVIKGKDIGEDWNARGSYHSKTMSSKYRNSLEQCVLKYNPLPEVGPDGSFLYPLTPDYGYRDVLVHDEKTLRIIQLNFMTFNGKPLADLSASDSQVVEVVDQVLGPCRSIQNETGALIQ